MSKQQPELGYLPDEKPPFFKLLLFAFQQIIVMFPATVLVALLTGFHVSTTIFASGLATIGFILITGRKIPLFYGSSFSYVTAICSITGAQAFAGPVADEKIAAAQFGIVLSGLVSILAGFIIKQFGQDAIEKVLPPTVTGSIAMVIGLSLSGTALRNPTILPNGVSDATKMLALNLSWTICIVTMIATIMFSIYLKGTWGQIPILLGLLTGYILALILGGMNNIVFCDFNKIESAGSLFAIPAIGFALPHFTLPVASWAAVAAIMPIAIATIPESTAHLYQLDIYVNDLAKKKGSNKRFRISDKLGLNLIGDGLGDMISGVIGGPAGTNYGENLSTMAITKNFSTPMLISAAILTMIISCFTPLISVVYSIPNAVIGGISIYLFGVIASQGVTIMISKKVDLFDSRSLAVISTMLTIGVGGSFAFSDGMIPMFGAKLPAIATAAIFGILLNIILNIGRKKTNDESTVEISEKTES